MSAADAEPLVLDLIEATPENFAPYGILISGSQVSAPGLTIPFYSHVSLSRVFVLSERVRACILYLFTCLCL